MLVRLASVLAGHHPDGLDTRARTALVGAVDRAARSGPPTQALLQEIGLAVGRLPRLRFDAATQLRDETSSILAAVVQDWLHHDEGSPQQQREFSNAAEGVLLLLAFWTGGRRLPLPEWSRPLRDAVADGARRRDPGFLAAAAVYLAAFSACPAAAADEREAAWMHAAALITSGVPPGADPHAWLRHSAPGLLAACGYLAEGAQSFSGKRAACEVALQLSGLVLAEAEGPPWRVLSEAAQPLFSMWEAVAGTDGERSLAAALGLNPTGGAALAAAAAAPQLLPRGLPAPPQAWAQAAAALCAAGIMRGRGASAEGRGGAQSSLSCLVARAPPPLRAQPLALPLMCLALAVYRAATGPLPPPAALLVASALLSPGGGLLCPLEAAAEAAAAGVAPADAVAALSLATASPLAAESPRLTRLICDSVAAAPAGLARAALALDLQLLFRDYAAAAHGLYRAVAVEAAADWAAAVVDTSALRRTLDAAFLAPVLFHSTARPAESVSAALAVAAAAGSSGRPAMSVAQSAAIALDTLAHLEFARMPFEAYGPLIEGSVALLSADSGACAAFVAECLPSYAEITAPLPRGPGAGLPAWSHDAVLGSRIHVVLRVAYVLLPVLDANEPAANGPGGAPQGVLYGRLAPVALLLLRHQTATVCAAAHAVCVAMLQGRHALRRRFGPAYIEAALRTFPQTSSLQSVGFAVRAMCRAFEPGDSLPAVMVAERVDELERSSIEKEAAAAEQLRLLLFHTVAMVDLLLVPHALEASRESIRRIRAGRGVQQAALEQLCDVVVNGADSVRKAECVQACLELGAALGA